LATALAAILGKFSLLAVRQFQRICPHHFIRLFIINGVRKNFCKLLVIAALGIQAEKIWHDADSTMLGVANLVADCAEHRVYERLTTMLFANQHDVAILGKAQ